MKLATSLLSTAGKRRSSGYLPGLVGYPIRSVSNPATFIEQRRNVPSRSATDAALGCPLIFSR